jgi:hypothetical protein
MLSNQQPLSHDQRDPGQVTTGAFSFRLLTKVSLLSNFSMIPHFIDPASRCSADWSQFTSNILKTLICLVVTGIGIVSLPTEANAQHQPTPRTSRSAFPQGQPYYPPHGGNSGYGGNRGRSYGGWGVVSSQGPGWVGGTFTSGGMITYNLPLFPAYYGGWGNYGAVPYYSTWGAFAPGMAGPIGGYSWGVTQTGPGWGPPIGGSVFTPVLGPNGFENRYVGTYGLGPLGGSIINSPSPGTPLPGINGGVPIGTGIIGPQGNMQPGNIPGGPIVDQFGIDAALVDPAQRPVAASSPDSKIKSLEAQSLGDHWFRQQQWAKAFTEYRKAVSLADDRGEAHFRTGLCLAAMGQFTSAVAYFKRALYLNPEIARDGESLVMLFGEDHDLARLNTIHRVSDWVRGDIRDTDRLFLLGLLLHFDRDPRSVEVLTAGLQMAGRGPHFETLPASQLAAAQPAPGEAQDQLPAIPGQNPSGLNPSNPLSNPSVRQQGQGMAQPLQPRYSPVNPPTSSYTVIQPRGAQNNPTIPPRTLPREPLFDPARPEPVPQSDLPPLPSKNVIDQQPPVPAIPQEAGGDSLPMQPSPLPPPPVAPLPEDEPTTRPTVPVAGSSGNMPVVVPPLPGVSGATTGTSQRIPAKPKPPVSSTGPMLPPPSP